MLRYFIYMLFLLTLNTAFAQDKHIRVVLDTSESMGKKYLNLQNDLDHLAVLSTQLLYDLVRPVNNDTFAVIPFDKNWPNRENYKTKRYKADPVVALPVSRRAFIRYSASKTRARFLAKIRRLKYTAKMTYFYPALKRAINDLPNTKNDIKVVILLTDGLPEKWVKDTDRDAIIRDLVPEIERKQIKFFILSFSKNGTNAYKNQQAAIKFFRDIMNPSASKNTIGTHTPVLHTDDLLNGIIDIFTLGFGYQAEGPLDASITTTLPLTDGYSTPADAAVITYHNNNRTPPDFKIKPSSNVNLNNPAGLASAYVKGETKKHFGASYALRWIVSPDFNGTYSLKMSPQVGKTDLFILRPAPVEIELIPRLPDTQMTQALAEKVLHLSALVRSKVGSRSFSGKDLEFSYKLIDRNGHPLTTDLSGKVNPMGISGAKGQVYDLDVVFPNKNHYYVGYIKIKVTRKGVKLTNLKHRIDVYPPLSIKSIPDIQFMSNQVLERGDSPCKSFQFVLEEGQLNQVSYGVQAYLDIPSHLLNEELYKSTFTLDGLPIYPEHYIFPSNIAVPMNKKWLLGRNLTKDELIGEHEVCLTVGAPKKGAINTPIQIKIGFILNENPYDVLDVIKPVLFKIKVDPPTLLEKYTHLLIFLIPLFILILLWYLRNKPSLPADLGYCLLPYERTNILPEVYPALKDLEEPSLLPKLLGLVIKKAVKTADTKETLVWVVPRKDPDELYRLKPHNKHIEISEFIQEEGALGIIYWITTTKQTYILKLGYFDEDNHEG